MDIVFKVATVALVVGAIGALALWGYLIGTQIHEWWRYRRIGR